MKQFLLCTHIHASEKNSIKIGFNGGIEKIFARFPFCDICESTLAINAGLNGGSEWN